MKNYLCTKILKHFFRGYIIEVNLALPQKLIHVKGLRLQLAIDLGALAAEDPDWIDVEITTDTPKDQLN